MNFKWITIPETNKDIEAVDCWEVRWNGHASKWHTDFVPEVEVFTTKKLASEFADALNAAFKLLRRVGAESDVIVSKR